MLLAGKRTIVTGGVTGIGRATVLAMVREGAAVVTMSRAPTDAPRTVETLEAAHRLGAGPITHVTIDVSSQSSVDRAFAEAIDAMGGLDALVNSAGIESQKPTEELTATDFLEQFSIHVLGTAFTNTAALRFMKERGGSIVNTASRAGLIGVPNMAAYSAAKAGVIAYSRLVAREWGRYGIRVNATVPSARTAMYTNWVSGLSPDQQAQVENMLSKEIPLRGELRGPEEAAHLNVFLVSDLSSYITGQLIPVDGGQVMVR